MSLVKARPVQKIQKEIFGTLMILASVMTVLIASISIVVNLKSESTYLDQNLQNMAQTIAQSQIVQEELSVDNQSQGSSVLYTYLDCLKESLSNIDVISIVGADSIRKYHTNESLIGTVYAGSVPDFEYGDNTFFVTDDVGPSGSQRRAYAAIYDDKGNYLGFMLVVMLNRNINKIIWNTVMIHLSCAVAVVLCAAIFSRKFSKRVKDKLLGYEPDTFSAMFSIRDNILESLEEGILAVGVDEKMIYMNKAAQNMLPIEPISYEDNKLSEVFPYLSLNRTLSLGEKSFGISVHSPQGSEILMDQIPVMEQGRVVGALCILRDRTEYTKLMEDLSGVRYMVESMRANNHDFINKLHVILGLIQMGNVKEASEYITHITSIQQTVIHSIIKNIEDPSIAALLIGKYARASELNIRFVLNVGSKLQRSDISLPSGDMVTIIGNLLDNAMDSMNEKLIPPKELSIGIFTQPHALMINIDDTGLGITSDNQSRIFENGFSTKGENRGTGLYVVKELVEKYRGTITVESEYGVGTSFTIILTDGGKENV